MAERSALGMLQSALFHFFLTLDTVTRPGDSLEPLGVNLLAAGDALAKAAFPDPFQRTFYHLQQLALTIALVEQEFLIVGAGGPVGDVLGRVLIALAPIQFRSRNVVPQEVLALL